MMSKGVTPRCCDQGQSGLYCLFSQATSARVPLRIPVWRTRIKVSEDDDGMLQKEWRDDVVEQVDHGCLFRILIHINDDKLVNLRYDCLRMS